MSWRDRLSNGLFKSRKKLNESMNILLRRGAKLDEDFWDDLEETLILADLGAPAADEAVENLRDKARREALPDAQAVVDALAEEIASLFTQAEVDPIDETPSCVLFVGINGAGKTTTVGKLAKAATDQAVSTPSPTLTSRRGRVARDAATVGASLIRSRSGEATVSVPAGYTFYIIDSRQ